jgi:predicted site-specific integrase-resolvase
VSTLYHWISDGVIVPVKYRNGAVRFDRKDLDRFIQKCKSRVSHAGDGNNDPKEA